MAVQPKARRSKLDSCDALQLFVLMHIVIPEPLHTSGRRALGKRKAAGRSGGLSTYQQ